MPLEALTSRDAVLAAMAEYDRVGRDAFLDRYGFRTARDVLVVHGGRRYDSKALVAAAHGHQHPDLGPLRHTEFNGGRPTISKLEELGFKIERMSAGHEEEGEPAGDSLARFLELYPEAKSEAFTAGHPAALALKQAADAFRHRLP